MFSFRTLYVEVYLGESLRDVCKGNNVSVHYMLRFIKKKLFRRKKFYKYVSVHYMLRFIRLCYGTWHG